MTAKKKKKTKVEAKGKAPDAAPVEEEKPEAPAETEQEKLVRERAEYLELAQFTAAELENYKKRVAKERANWERDAVACFACDLLNSLDNLQRALDSGDCGEAFRGGVQMIAGQIRGVFENAGIEEIKSDACRFDTCLHEAVMVEETADVPANTVLETLQKGYALGDRVVRHAKVKVSRAPELEKAGSGTAEERDNDAEKDSEE